MGGEVYKIPNKPWWWPKSFKFRVIFIWVIVFVLLMNLQNLRVIAKSVEPFVLGLPLSLFFVFVLSIISTAAIVGIYFLWKDFIKRTD